MNTNGATITIREAAARLRVHESTVRNWIDRGYLNGYRLPSGQRRLPKESVERLLGEMFAVPTSIPDDDSSHTVTKPERAEPVFEGPLP